MTVLAYTAPEQVAAQPIVKWVGGKGKLLPELLARAPKTFRRYHEPFAGGAALFFRLRPAEATLSDLNACLIDAYRAVRDDVEAVIRALAHHRDLHSEEHYYLARDAWNASDPLSADMSVRAALFLYLNKTCYNGLWRENKRGKFNVPAGHYANPGILDEGRLRAASASLARVDLQWRSYEHVLQTAKVGDFVYFDPPYDPVSETARFTGYAAGGFGSDDQRALAKVFDALAARGCAVMLSNSDTPFTRELYRNHRVDRVLAPRSVNSRADRRGAVGEIIVRGGFA